MVIRYTLQGPGDSDTYKRGKTKKSSVHKRSTPEPNRRIEGWWVARVPPHKEYIVKRGLIASGVFEEEDVLVPRKSIYRMVDYDLKKRTEMVFPGYVVVNMSNIKNQVEFERSRTLVKLLGAITREEMETIKSFEEEPERTDASEGDRIIVLRGPFAGVKGNIVKYIDEFHVNCVLTFQGHEINATLESNRIERLV